MDAYLRSLVLCRLYTTIIRQIKKDLGEIEKREKYCQKNVYVRITYNPLSVCVVGYICVLLCVVIYVIVSMCARIMIHTLPGRFQKKQYKGRLMLQENILNHKRP